MGSHCKIHLQIRIITSTAPLSTMLGWCSPTLYQDETPTQIAYDDHKH